MHRFALILVASLTTVTTGSLVPPAALAQTAGSAALLGCAAKVDDSERLACYDALAAGVSAEGRAVASRREAARQAQAAAAAAEVEKARKAAEAAAEAAKQDSFGKAQSDSEQIDELPVVISEVMQDKRGRYVFMLDNGQIWRQVEPYPLPPIKDGTAATLKRGALGSYRIKIAGTNRNIPVIRNR